MEALDPAGLTGWAFWLVLVFAVGDRFFAAAKWWVDSGLRKAERQNSARLEAMDEKLDGFESRWDKAADHFRRDVIVALGASMREIKEIRQDIARILDRTDRNG